MQNLFDVTKLLCKCYGMCEQAPGSLPPATGHALKREDRVLPISRRAAARSRIRPDRIKRTEVAKMVQKWCENLQIVRICPRLSAFVRVCPRLPALFFGSGGREVSGYRCVGEGRTVMRTTAVFGAFCFAWFRFISLYLAWYRFAVGAARSETAKDNACCVLRVAWAFRLILANSPYSAFFSAVVKSTSSFAKATADRMADKGAASF
jgi:hypothetical protein